MIFDKGKGNKYSDEIPINIYAHTTIKLRGNPP
jgi:hypothetical protein